MQQKQNVVICFHIQLYAANHLSMEVTLLNSSSIREEQAQPVQKLKMK